MFGLVCPFLLGVSLLNERTSGSLVDPPEELADRVAGFLDQIAHEADVIEVWARRDRETGRMLGEPDEQRRLGERLAVRTWRGNAMGCATAADSSDDAWWAAVREALDTASPSPVPPPGPPSARSPEPSIFDPALPEALVEQDLLYRLARALEENSRHEAERIPGLSRLTGQVTFAARQRVVGNSVGGVLSEQLGELFCEVDLDGRHGEQVRIVHLADSFLPFALMGARAWRSMPRATAEPTPGERAPVGVVLHPRVLEALLRAGLAPLLAEPEDGTPPPFSEGELIMDPAITLVDDPGLDGLAGSRAFDDEGVATRRTALIIRGRMTQHLRGRQSAQRTGRPATGSMIRSARKTESNRVVPSSVAFGEACAPALGVTCVLMERGQPQFHDLVADASRLLVLHALAGDLQVDPVTTAFVATIRWATLLEDGRPAHALAPGAWRIRGHLLALASDHGLLHGLVPCRDVLDTGTGILPYARGEVMLEATT